MDKIKILYVEDDSSLAFVTKDNLEQSGYEVSHFENGALALDSFKAKDYALCILDVMLPKIDGFDLAARMRKINTHIPILFLSARSADEDRIHGLKLGGDDYITKPFIMDELILKIEVFLRRSKVQETNSKPTIFEVSHCVLDLPNQTLTMYNNSQQLTEREAKLLSMFLSKPMQLIKREEILLELWGDDGYFAGRSLDVFISKIRKYIKEDEGLKIENIHGIGFRLIVQ